MAKKVKIFSTYDLSELARRRKALDDAGISYTVKSGSMVTDMFYLLTSMFSSHNRGRELMVEDSKTHPLYTIYVNEEDGPKAMMNDHK